MITASDKPRFDKNLQRSISNHFKFYTVKIIRLVDLIQKNSKSWNDIIKANKILPKFNIIKKIQVENQQSIGERQMPRVHNQAKQKNKPFKGKQNAKKGNNKIASTKTKHIAKKKNYVRIKQHKNQLIKAKKMRKINIVQKLANQNEYLDQHTKTVITEKMKNESEIKIVLLLPCNQDADCNSLIKELHQSIDQQSIMIRNSQTQMNCFKSFFSFQMFPISNKSYLKSKIQFIAPSRQINQLIDLAKCADIICPVLSCKSTNTQGMNLDPYVSGKAFDQVGYTILNMLRSFGVPTTVGIIQHVEIHQPKNHDKIIRLFKRFMASELGEEEKIFTLSNPNDLNKLIRTIDSINIQQQFWKNQRGYMLVQNLSKNNNGQIVLQGFLKGNCINANQLIHVTGLDDFQIESIQIVKNHGKILRLKKSQIETEDEAPLIQCSTNSQSLFEFAQEIQNRVGKSQNELLSAIEGLKFENSNKKDNQDIDEEDNDADFQDIEENEEMDDSLDQNQILGDKDEERRKRIQIQMRKQDQLEFQDQVQYTVDDILREKFRNYQGLKNFKTSEWNHLENLPEQYEKIFSFKHYTKTQSNAISQNISKAFAYPGFFISVVVRALESKEKQLQKILAQGPLIGSFLLKHQRKMTMVHARIKRNPYYPLNDSQIKSNQKYFVTIGFRKIYITPIFSRCINGTEKTKYTKKIKEDYENYYYCSFYYYNYFPPAPFSIYRINQVNTNIIEPSPVMYGELIKCDPLHIILERIILCGYPYKINRRRCTVRYMFFDPKDVKFFKPIEVRTKMGLRGRIEESLGMHGLMKVFFNEQIKQNDTVCMYLYKRVYPQPYF